MNLQTQSYRQKSILDWLEYRQNYQSKLDLANISQKKQLDSNDISVGMTSADKSVIVGKQGWFYITSGSNHLMEYHTGERRLPRLKVDQWEQLLSERKKWHNSCGIKYHHIFIPNKIAVYPEYYPYHLDIKHNRPILQLQQKFSQLFSYPLDLFFHYKKFFRLYEKQDCHWSYWSCYLTYELLCHKFGITPNSKLLDFTIEIIQKKGDLGNKFNLNEKRLEPKFKYSSQIIHDNQVINHSHQGSIRILKNSQVSDGKLLIFGDSFSNPGIPDYSYQKRVAARLSTLFAETLNEVHFIWTPWIDYDYIRQEKPDFVLTEMAERFLVRVPNDLEHLPLHEFAAYKLNQSKLLNKDCKTRKTGQADGVLQKAKENFKRGEKFKKEDSLTKAIAEYKKAIKIKPDYVQALISLGEIHQKQQKWGEATQYYRRVVSLEPHRYGIFVKLARVLKQQNKIYGAIAAYAEAIELKSDLNPIVYQDYQKLLLQINNNNPDTVVLKENKATTVEDSILESTEESCNNFVT